jgi:aspartate kinase
MDALSCGDKSDAAEQRTDCIVMKFGGTSVEDAPAMRRVSQLVKERLGQKPVVVVSALAKVTDQLFAAGLAAAEGDREVVLEAVQRLRQRHEQIAAELLERENYDRLRNDLEGEFQALDEALCSIAAEGQFSPRAQDNLLGRGEALSSRIVQAVLWKDGLDAVLLDAKQCIITDAAHTRATPLWDETNQRLKAALLPLLESGCIPVLGGFVGSTRDGVPTTLGRGGSDFSAAIAGAALRATRIEIWTDVDGVMTTDPAICPNARRVPRMSFDEAAELAYFGAKVLHPATLLPAMRHDIPVWVLNSRNHGFKGTEIRAYSGGEGRVKAITVKRGIAVVDVEPVRWLAPELLREVCDVFERHQQTLDLLSASRGGLSLLVTSIRALPAIAAELKGMANLRWENHKALVCLVGEKIRRQPEIASQVFRSISDVETRMICQGASERSLSFLVDEARADESVRRLHHLFFPSPDVPAATFQSQAMCQAGEAWP